MIKNLINFIKKIEFSMDSNDKEQNSFKLFYSSEDDENQQNQKLTNNDLSPNSKNEIKFQKALYNNRRKISADPGNEFTNRLNMQFGLEKNYNRFNFNTPLQIKDQNQKSFSEKSNYAKLNFSKKLINEDLLYVVFENLYGENSCFLNVILHFLYFFPSVYDFVTNIYQNNLTAFQINNNNNYNLDFFIFLLGNILSQYRNILSNPGNKGIITLSTLELRKCLNAINNKFQLNTVGDPIELLIYILDIINKHNETEIHNNFFLNLIEENKCILGCQNDNNYIQYDKDNFIFQIYTDEIFQYLKKNQLHFNDYKYKLFSLSKEVYAETEKKCEKCNSPMRKIINLKQNPKFLLVNCVWKKNIPELKDVIRFLHMISLEDNINNLFTCQNNNLQSVYNLLGVIFYSAGLCHYICILYNMQKNVFTLLNDNEVIECKTVHEIYRIITVEQLRNDSKFFYYPVLLVYINEMIYYVDENMIRNNQYTSEQYNKLISDCNQVINNNIMTIEQKRQNYIDHYNAQIKFDLARKKIFNDNSLNGEYSQFLFADNENKETKSKNIMNEDSKNGDYVKEKNILDYNNMMNEKNDDLKLSMNFMNESNFNAIKNYNEEINNNNDDNNLTFNNDGMEVEDEKNNNNFRITKKHNTSEFPNKSSFKYFNNNQRVFGSNSVENVNINDEYKLNNSKHFSDTEIMQLSGKQFHNEMIIENVIKEEVKLENNISGNDVIIIKEKNSNNNNKKRRFFNKIM